MVQADERSSFGESVALDDRVAEAMPEFFGFAIERGAAADDRQEFPPKLAANAAEGPPAAQEVLVRGARVIGGERLAAAACFQIAFDLLLERVDQAGNSDQNGDALAMNGGDDFRGIEGIFEDDGGAEKRWNKNSEELSEDVAEWKKVEKTQGMDEALVFEIFCDLLRDGSEVADHVGMGENDSLGLGGRAGGEDDFQGIGRLNGKRTKAVSGMLSDSRGEVGGIEGGESFEMWGALAWTQDELRTHLPADAAREIGTGSVVNGNGENSRESAAQERSDPFGRVRAPEKDRVALGDVARGEFARELMSGSGDLRVGPALVAISARIHVGGLRAPALEIVQIVQ